MKIYIDADFKCHVSGDESMKTVETEFFNDKCAEYIEGYRFVPDGESWTREDGVIFPGEMVAPWKPFDELDEAQREYEQEQLRDALNALSILGVKPNG